MDSNSFQNGAVCDNRNKSMYTHIPIIIGLSVDTSQARSVPRLSPTNIHSNAG